MRPADVTVTLRASGKGWALDVFTTLLGTPLVYKPQRLLLGVLNSTPSHLALVCPPGIQPTNSHWTCSLSVAFTHLRQPSWVRSAWVTHAPPTRLWNFLFSSGFWLKLTDVLSFLYGIKINFLDPCGRVPFSLQLKLFFSRMGSVFLFRVDFVSCGSGNHFSRSPHNRILIFKLSSIWWMLSISLVLLVQEQVPKQSAGFTSGLLLRRSTECILYGGILVCCVNTWNYDNPLPQVNLWRCHGTDEGLSETRSYCYGIKSSQSSPTSGLTIHTKRHTPYSLRWHTWVSTHSPGHPNYYNASFQRFSPKHCKASSSAYSSFLSLGTCFSL